MRSSARKRVLVALDLPLSEHFGEGRYVLSTADHLHDADEFELAIAAVTTEGVVATDHELLKYPIPVDKAPLFAPKSAAERRLPSYASLQEAQVDEMQRVLHAGLADAVKDFSPDIVHVHHAFLLVPAAAALGAIWSVPFIVTAHGIEMQTAARDRRYADLVGPSLRRASGLTAVSASVRRDLGQLFGRGIEGGVHVVPGGVDTTTFHPETVSEEEIALLNLENDLAGKKVALFVGSLTPEKGIDVLLDAADNMMDVEFRLVGETREDGRGQEIHDRIEECANVQAFPSLAPQALLQWYGRADVFVMPSLDEGFGLVALEAMACGKPVVVSRSEAMESIVQDGVNGYLVPPGQAFALSRAINKAVSEPKHAASMGQRARDTVELRYSWPTITDMLRPIYRQALGPPLPFAAR